MKRKYFVQKLTGELGKLHNVELRNLFGNADTIRAHKLSLSKPKGKRPHGRLKIMLEDNIIRDLKEVD